MQEIPCNIAYLLTSLCNTVRENIRENTLLSCTERDRTLGQILTSECGSFGSVMARHLWDLLSAAESDILSP